MRYSKTALADEKRSVSRLAKKVPKTLYNRPGRPREARAGSKLRMENQLVKDLLLVNDGGGRAEVERMKMAQAWGVFAPSRDPRRADRVRLDALDEKGVVVKRVVVLQICTAT